MKIPFGIFKALLSCPQTFSIAVEKYWFFVAYPPTSPPSGPLWEYIWSSYFFFNPWCSGISIEVFWYRSLFNVEAFWGTHWFGNSYFFSSEIFSPIFVLGKNSDCHCSRSLIDGVLGSIEFIIQFVESWISPQFLVGYLVTILTYAQVQSLFGDLSRVNFPSDFSAWDL